MLRHARLAPALAAGAAGHAMMTLPTPRNGGSLALGGTGPTAAFASWYTDKAHIPGKPTLPSGMSTSRGLVNSRCIPGMCPWRAPGATPVKSPCGNTMGVLPAGEDVPGNANNTVTWQRGSTQRAAWAIFQNHGGGYAWRLCPKTGATALRPTEECFQQHHLEFVGNTTTIHYAADSIHALEPEFDIPAQRTTTGTTPAGSEWTRNPIPSDETVVPPFAAPFKGGSGSVCAFSLVDRVAVPADIEPGDYWLGFRWDCEINPQIYLNCGDLVIE